jgi:hypothetical protein
VRHSLRLNHIATWLRSWLQLGPSSFGISNDHGALGSLLRRLRLPNGPDGAEQVKVKPLAHRARLGVFLLSLVLWLESCRPQWCGSLVDRLRYLSHKCTLVGRGAKALVLRLCGLRSSPTSILAALEHKMATLEHDQPQGEIQVCQWCRMGLHKKCERHKLHTICVCDCERGY